MPVEHGSVMFRPAAGQWALVSGSPSFTCDAHGVTRFGWSSSFYDCSERERLHIPTATAASCSRSSQLSHRVATCDMDRVKTGKLLRLTAAFPPALRMSMPHFAARGCEHAMMPLVLWTTLLLLLNLANSIGPGGNNEDVEEGILSSSSSHSACTSILVGWTGEEKALVMLGTRAATVICSCLAC